MTYSPSSQLARSRRCLSRQEGELIIKEINKNLVTDDGYPIVENVLLDDRHIKCPVCGRRVRFYTTCANCNWENGGHYEVDGGPNEMTLEEAKKAYKEGRPIT